MTSTYTVAPGDSLSKIGKRLGVDWREIARLNDLENPSLILVGQVLLLPEEAVIPTTEPAPAQMPAGWVWPVDVLPGLHKVNHPYHEKRVSRAGYVWYHEGVDLYARTGDRILAVAAGTVKLTHVWDGRLSGWDNYGNHVVLALPGDLEVLYAHLSRISVVEGQALQPGEQIGLAGSTGNSTAAHLHLHVRSPLGEASVLRQFTLDPMQFLPENGN